MKCGTILKMRILIQLRHTFIDLERKLKIYSSMIILSLIMKMAIHYEKRNKFALELFTKKYRKRVVKPKKGKGSFKRKKNN